MNSDIIREDLMQQYRWLLSEGKYSMELITSLLVVIRFYSNDDEYDEFINSTDSHEYNRLVGNY